MFNKIKIIPKDAELQDNVYLFHLNITYRCNLFCSYCYNRYLLVNRDNISSDMHKETLQKIVKNINMYFKNRPENINIWLLGGEPCLHPEFESLVDILLSIDNLNKLKIFTNGTLPDVYLKLKKDILKKRSITISYHAEKVKYYTFIDILDRICASYLDLQDLPHVIVYLDNNYKEDVDKVLYYLHKIKYPFVKISSLKKQHQCNTVDYNEYDTYVKKWNLKNEKAILQIYKDDIIIDEIPEQQLSNGYFYGLNCMYKRNAFRIEPNGEIISACNNKTTKNKKRYYAFMQKHLTNILDYYDKECVCNEKNGFCNCSLSYGYSKYGFYSKDDKYAKSRTDII